MTEIDFASQGPFPFSSREVRSIASVAGNKPDGTSAFVDSELFFPIFWKAVIPFPLYLTAYLCQMKSEQRGQSCCDLLRYGITMPEYPYPYPENRIYLGRKKANRTNTRPIPFPRTISFSNKHGTPLAL